MGKITEAGSYNGEQSSLGSTVAVV